jgi:hypothetical protein
VRVIRFLLLTMSLPVLPGAALAAEEVTVLELVDSGAEVAGQEVVVEGELIGDYGFRGDGWMWTQLNGDTYVRAPTGEGGSPAGANVGIGVRMPIELAEGLDPPGRYRSRGPIVRATGTWRYHDRERQGESYLQVRGLVVIEDGRELHEAPDWRVFLVGALLVAAAVGVWRVRPEE